MALLAAGSMVKTAVEVRELLLQKGIDATIVNARFIKPIDTDMIASLTKNHRLFVTMEENVLSGGYGERVSEYLEESGLHKEVLHIALPDAYVEHGNVDILKEELGIDPASIVHKIISRLETEDTH